MENNVFDDTKDIFISRRALCFMNNELLRYPYDETGGLLLGYTQAEFGICNIVVEATDAGFQNVIHEKYTFEYDAQYEEHIANILSSLYNPPLELIGVWHKHNNVSETKFSEADKEMHRKLLAITNHPCFSILFEKESDERYRFNIFSLSVSGHKDVTNNIQIKESEDFYMNDHCDILSNLKSNSDNTNF